MGDLDSRLDALQQRYCASLAEKLGAIELAWSAVRIDGNDIANQEALLNLVHRLAGSAGSYGFYEIGDAAADVDELLDPARITRDPAARSVAMPDLLDRLSPALETLRVAMQRRIDQQGACGASVI